MTIEKTFEMLEKGETVQTLPNDGLLNAMRIVMNDTYTKFDIDVQISNGVMTLTRNGEFIRKQSSVFK